MVTKVILPKWGMGIEEGLVMKWYRREGDFVAEGEPLVDIETAKAVQAVESPVKGRLIKILVQEGSMAVVNSDIALIEQQE